MTEKEKAMQTLRQHSFAAIDAALYLDGHPDDEAALQYFRMTCKKRQQAKEQYQKHFGALTQCAAQDADTRWHWTRDPWPWEEA